MIETAAPAHTPAGPDAPADPRSTLPSERSAAISRAYDEYCRRREAGEDVDREAFCARHPEIRDSLAELIGAHHFMEGAAARQEAAHEPAFPEPGDYFLGFELRAELGRGGFARVYLATEPALGGRQVAVKVSRHGGGEAQTLGPIHHPNVMAVHSSRFDPDSGLTAVCMPYVGSATLADVLRHLGPGGPRPGRAAAIAAAVRAVSRADTPSGPAPADGPLASAGYAEGVAHLGARLADALAHLHGRRVCHRDVKPSNVLLTPAGTPVLLDFNLSADRAGDGRVVGTVPYMAPEQLRALPPDGDPAAVVGAPADVFALGVVLYEVLTGVHPFGPVPAGAPVAECRPLLLERQRAGHRPVRRVNPKVGRPLARVVERCLEAEPHRRPAADEVARLLRRLARAEPRAGRWLGGRRRTAAAAAAVLVTLAAAVVYEVRPQAPSPAREMELGRVAYRSGRLAEAVGHYDRVLAAGKTPEGLVARGRAYQRQQDFAAAARDYLEAADLYRRADATAEKARVDALIGYCLSRGGDDDHAMPHHLEAVQGHYDLAPVRLNLAWCFANRSQWDMARQTLAQLLKVAPSWQLAHHAAARFKLRYARFNLQNRAPRRALRIAADGLADAKRAIRLGPPSADLYRTAAQLDSIVSAAEPHNRQVLLASLPAPGTPWGAIAPLLAARGRLDPKWTQRVADRLQLAVRKGDDPRVYAGNFYFGPLVLEPEFQAVTRLPAPARAAPRFDPLSDPVADDE